VPPAIRIPSVSVCGLLLTACLFDGGKGARKAIVPLAVGNTWHYVDSAHFGNDSVSVDSSRNAITGTRVISPGGKAQTVYLLNSLDPVTGQPRAGSAYLQDRSDGNYTMGAAQDGAEFLTEVLHLEHPAQEGHRYPTWFVSFRAENGALVPVIDTLEIEVVDADLTCSVPAGTFACVKYRGWRDTVLHATAYYAPGVGYLGSEQIRTIEVNGTPREILITSRLRAFTLH
jgi:hypothetical protein